jgi:proton-dependent oligopeptide transporter, POT family
MQQATAQKMPSGIPYIIGNEAAERFSFYGMKAILVTYMTLHLGMADGQASSWLHNFNAAVYAFPFIGALIADIFWGKYKTILTLSIVYTAGHGVLALAEFRPDMATDFLVVGLTLIAIGSGGIKPCVSANVGDQFTSRNAHLIERAFSYFYLSINFGSFFATLLIPWTLKAFGPSLAFGLPGIFMAIATLVFWLGRRKFTVIPPAGGAFIRDLVSPPVLKTIAGLLLIYVFIGVFWSLYDQTYSSWILQARSDLMIKTVDLGLFSFTVLPEQILAVNPLLILTLTPLFTFFVYPWMSRVMRVTPLRKIGIGFVITALSFVVIGMAEGRIAAGEPVSVSWQLWAYFIITAAEVMVSITALEFSYQQAPNRMKSFIMSLFLLSITFGNLIAGEVNRRIVEPVSVQALETGARTYVRLDDVDGIQRGHKLDISGTRGVSLADGGTLSGTYLVGEVDPIGQRVELVNIRNREPLVSQGEPAGAVSAARYTLNGADYFYFFAWLMLGATVVFVGIARFYREQTHVQDEAPAEAAST